MKILFLRNEKSFLPEINAYIKYFNKIEGIHAYDSSLFENQLDINDFDVIWEFKGTGGVVDKNKVLVHEYASLSTGKLAKLKNIVKSKINPKPDIRVFLNKEVKSGFNFNDGIKYLYRDMGLDEVFINRKRPIKKEYKFVYVGPITREREIDKLLNNISSTKSGKIHLIGNVEDTIYNQFKNNSDIIFTGKVNHEEVPKIAERAEYAINYIPDKYPYHIQTSTKLLEYLALDLKIISTSYKWVKEFENVIDSSFYYLNTENKNWFEGIDEFSFRNNFNSIDYSWEKIIQETKIENILIDIFNSKS